uniref:Trypsin-1 n=1 Tax=Lygus hesperus TaxID=30085 RepID=A0A0A9YSF2_LYGHE
MILGMRIPEFPRFDMTTITEAEMSHGHEAHNHDEDERFENNSHQHSFDHGGVISSGILITTSRILTTCDSVGFFTGSKVTLYALEKVNVMAGSVKSTGEGGQFRTPSNSNVHPLCYFSSTVSNILFNYGVYEFNESFDSLVHPDTGIPVIQPIQTEFKNRHDMETSLFNLRTEGIVECSAAAWGNQKKEFEGRGMPDHFQRFAPILQATSMKIVDYPECIEATCEYFDECHLNIWESGFICAKAQQGGPCKEDRAAPLICGGEVFGLHVYALRCATRGFPRHFLRIDLAFDYVFGITNQGNAVAGVKIFGPLLIALYFHDIYSTHTAYIIT